MDHFRRIYTWHAAQYHRLIAAEDADNNLLVALEEITPWQNKRILDLGSGTGRIPLILADQTAQIIGLDLHYPMLHQNQTQRDLIKGTWLLVQADMHNLPFPPAWADITTAGWSIGHLRNWFAPHWKQHIDQVLREMFRVSVKGGYLIIIETLGTGSLTPGPPTHQLAQYYAWLEEEWGFTKRVIRTDYQFESVEQAVELAGFFFGPDMAKCIRDKGWHRLPEWTGIWFRET